MPTLEIWTIWTIWKIWMIWMIWKVLMILMTLISPTNLTILKIGKKLPSFVRRGAFWMFSLAILWVYHSADTT